MAHDRLVLVWQLECTELAGSRLEEHLSDDGRISLDVRGVREYLLLARPDKEDDVIVRVTVNERRDPQEVIRTISSRMWN